MPESKEEVRQENLNLIVEEIVSNNPHLVTGGARRYFKRVWIGYAVLAIACVVGIWSFTNRADDNLRTEINKLSVASCLGGIKTINKYNDFVNSQIETQRESLRLAIQQNDKKRAKINESAINRYTRDKLVPPTVPACSKPILK